MSLRRVLAFGFSIGVSLTVLSAQEPIVEAPSWSAPPFWTAPPKPAGDKTLEPGVGPFGTEAAGVIPSPPMPFVAINPCRIADTRGGMFTGQAGAPILTGATVRTFQVAGTVPGIPIPCGIPPAAQAVSFQFSVVGMNSNGNLIAWPEGPPPSTSVLNWNASSVVIGSGTVVGLSGTGAVNVALNAPAGGSTHLIIDVNGYYSPAGSWSLTGNSGTMPGTHFVGTTDNQAVELKVNGERALRLEPLVFAGTWGPHVIGGFSGNFVTAGKVGGTIGGGGQIGLVNRVTEDFGTVGGGWGNNAAGYASVVGGGRGNAATGEHTAVSAGRDNTASGAYATVPGGLNNTAQGDYSFAGGRRSKANHSGSFVWADSNDSDFSSSAANQFAVRATGGLRFLMGGGVLCQLTDATGWQCGSPSDRNLKTKVVPVDGLETLERLVALPIQTWSYIDHEPNARHMGPMAQDFAAAFGLGDDDTRINPLDANGVALAAIQGLYEEVQELRRRLAALEEAKN